jgi:hypothetical protein
VFGEQVEPLEGAQIIGPSASSGPEDLVGIVAELTALRPGRHELTSVRLRYRLNGREHVGEGTDLIFTVCADDPKPKECSEQSATSEP